MDGLSFRRDRFLRTSAYNMGTWAVLNMLFSLPMYGVAMGQPWSPAVAGGYSLLLFATGLAFGWVHERRVLKMVGPPADPPLMRAELLWAPLLLGGIATTITLVVTERAQFVQPLWLLAAGSGYLFWGVLLRFREYWASGAVLVAGGVLAFSLQDWSIGAPPSVLGLHIWNVLMGAGSLLVAIAVNRRYLW